MLLQGYNNINLNCCDYLVSLPAAELSLVDGSKECIFLSGISLGLQPKNALKYLKEELHNWAKLLVHVTFGVLMISGVLFKFFKIKCSKLCLISMFYARLSLCFNMK